MSMNTFHLFMICFTVITCVAMITNAIDKVGGKK